MDFNSLIGLMDKEIELYKQLRILYSDKKNSLIKNDIKSLKNIDNQILELISKIKICETKRLKIAGDKFNNISALINYAKIESPEYLNKLENQKIEINKLAKEISHLHKTNLDLVKHGLVLSDKTLQLIIKICREGNRNYSSSGFSKFNTPISTIIQEA